MPGRQIERCAKLDIAGVDGQLFPSSLNAHRPKLLTAGGCEDQRCDTIMGSYETDRGYLRPREQPLAK